MESIVDVSRMPSPVHLGTGEYLGDPATPVRIPNVREVSISEKGTYPTKFYRESLSIPLVRFDANVVNIDLKELGVEEVDIKTGSIRFGKPRTLICERGLFPSVLKCREETW